MIQNYLHFYGKDVKRLNNIINLIKKDYKLFIKDRVAMSLTFAVPIALIFIFGQVFGGSDSPQKLRIGFINKSSSEIARKKPELQ